MLRSISLALVSSALALQAAAQVPDTTRYTFLTASHPAGMQLVWREADGTRYASFEFNDRGRGPKVLEKISLGSDGIPTAIEITGNDYFKNAVAERFWIAGGAAHWKSAAEQGSSAATHAVYTSFDAAPEEGAVFARALLAAPEHKLAILPAGEARIARVGDRALTADGKSRHVTLYAVSGLGFTPNPLWLDDDGEFFAGGSTWSMLIRQGWESVAPELVQVQNAADAQRSSDLARSLARRPTTSLAITNARLFDAVTATSHPHRTIVVTGNRIVAVGADGHVTIPKDAEMIDAAGKTVMPGLWDMHVHIQDDDGIFQLASGVTSVRDMANDTDELLERRKKFDDGSLVGPRIMMAGFIDGPGPFAGPSKILVPAGDVDSARHVVQNYARLGYAQIKVYSSLDTALLRPIAEEAHKLGMRVSGHVPAFMTAEQMIRDGADEIQHANFLFLNFWGDSVKDTRTPLRFTAVAERAALLDLRSPRVQAFLKLMKDRHIVSDPTVNVFENMFVARKGTIDPGYASIADRLPPSVRRGSLGGGLPVPKGMDQRYRDSFAAMLRLVKMMHDRGITIVAGTDAFAGFALHRELELYARAGIPNGEVLQLATLGAARVMKRDSVLGSVAPGEAPDLIMIDGDPVARISDIRRTELVIKDGTIFVPADLYRAMGVMPVAKNEASRGTK